MGSIGKKVVFGLILTSVLTTALANPSKRQRFSIEPKDVHVRLNGTARMHCGVQYKKGELQWMGKDDFSVYNENYRTSFTDGFEVEHTLFGEIETYTLVIKNVNYEHNGNYHCQVGNSNNDFNDGIRSRYAKLTVHHFFQKPEILNASLEALWPGQEIVCRCGAVPPPSIRWMDDATHDYSDYSTSVTECVSVDLGGGDRPQEMCVTTSTLKLPMSVFRNHLEIRLDCLAFNDEFLAEFIMISSMKLYLEFPPEDTRILPTYALEGRPARYVCETNGSPRNFTFEWYIGKELKLRENLSSTRSILQIPNVTRSLDNVDLECRVGHKLGHSKVWTTIDVIRVQYGAKAPVLSVVASMNDKVSLTCGEPGSLLPNVTWYFQSFDQVAGTGYEIQKVANPNTTGRYLCESLIEGFRVRREVWILIRGPPKIFKMDEYVSPDSNSITVRCVIHAIPKPTTTWVLSNGLRIVNETRSLRFRVRNMPTHLGVLSIITVSNVLSEDFGQYYCIASNEFASVNKTVAVSNRGSSVLAKLKILAVIFIAIVTLIYVALIVIWIVRCYHKMCPKHETELPYNIDESSCKLSPVKVITKDNDYTSSTLVAPEIPKLSIIEVLEEIEKCSLVNNSGSTEGGICSSQSSFASTIEISDGQLSTAM